MNRFAETLGKTGPFFVLFLSLIPIPLWYPYSSWTGPVPILRSLGQITALIGTALFSIDFVLSSRFRLVEPLFEGLNRAYIIHHLVGAVAFILLLFHPLFLILSYLFISLPAAAAFIIPTMENIPVLLGSLALLCMTVLLVLTLFVNLEYDLWKKTHIWLGVPLFLASAHALLVGSTLAQSAGLKWYMIALLTGGLVSFGYRIWRKYFRPTQYTYSITLVEQKNGATVLTLVPDASPMRFYPGQFAYLTFTHRGVSKESHPFSIVNAPGGNTLTFAAKSYGDFTESMKLLEPGTPVGVEGPYGRFSYTYINSRRYIWIAGGIGVTPFASMAASLPKNSGLSVDFFYCVKDASEALMSEEISRFCESSGARFTLWESATQGRFGINIIKEKIPDYSTATFMICGPPPMMQSLKEQLYKAGIKKRRVITEEFSLT